MASRSVSQPAKHSTVVIVAAYTLQLTAEVSTTYSLFQWSSEDEPHAILKKQGMHTAGSLPRGNRTNESRERNSTGDTVNAAAHA